MDLQQLLFSNGSTILFVIKIGIYLFLVIYVVFAATIIKQVRIMVDTLSTGFETQLKLVVLLHFIFALLVLILAFIIL